MSMSEQKRVLIAGGASLGLALMVGGLLYWQHDVLVKDRQAAAELEASIGRDRALLVETPELEQAVILQRETDEAIAQILPNDDDVLDFVRTLSDLGRRAEVTITQAREKTVSDSKKKKDQGDFRRVAYTINFDADAFQMLSFLDEVESHARFMRVPSLRLTAAPRRDADDQALQPLHSISMEVETYVYAPQSGIKAVAIENYERKAQLLHTAVVARQRELAIPSYDYAGPRNRRDPWVDPRVSVDAAAQGGKLPIPEQLALLEQLVAGADRAEELWQAWRDAPNLIAEMQARRALEAALVAVEREIVVHQTAESFSYYPARTQFDADVVDAVAQIRARMSLQDEQLPRIEVLQGTIETMLRHMELREFDQAQLAFRNIESRLSLALVDDLRRPLAQKIQELALKVETVLAFDGLGLDVHGMVDLGPGKRVVLIDGSAYSAGDLVDSELILYAIRDGELDFVFRGVLLTMPLETPSAGGSKAGR
jgi:hypothetical protein